MTSRAHLPRSCRAWSPRATVRLACSSNSRSPRDHFLRFPSACDPTVRDFLGDRSTAALDAHSSQPVALKARTLSLFLPSSRNCEHMAKRPVFFPDLSEQCSFLCFSFVLLPGWPAWTCKMRVRHVKEISTPCQHHLLLSFVLIPNSLPLPRQVHESRRTPPSALMRIDIPGSTSSAGAAALLDQGLRRAIPSAAHLLVP